MARYSFLAIAAACLAGASNALELNKSNFDEMTAGKTVFLKFYAPWCGHCKSMAKDWEKLEKDFEGHEVALVASVDCTDTSTDKICSDFNVEGFPTLAWGDVSSPEPYDGGRDYASMKAFADKQVTKPVCSLFNTDACSDEEKAEIAAVDGKSDEELLAAATKIAELAKTEEKKFEAFVENLQSEYEKMTNEHNAVLEKIKTENKFKFISMTMKKRNLKSPLDADDDDDDDDDLTGGEL
jgi:protein disulfide-isomerase-like protein